MDATINKQYKVYSYQSRYDGSPIYYNTNDNKWVGGLTKHLVMVNEPLIRKVKEGDTLDSLANRVYSGHSECWDKIADYNGIINPFDADNNHSLKENYEELKIPPYNYTDRETTLR